MLKIVIGGAQGRVGQFLCELAKKDPEIELIAGVGRPNNGMGGLESVTTPFGVFIDFSVPDAISSHLRYCVEHKNAMVIGVTGLNETQIAEIKEASKTIPIVFSPNMSIGINLLYKLLEISIAVLKENSPEFDVAIHETHHRNKKDAPSGTALRMQSVMQGKIAHHHSQTHDQNQTHQHQINIASTRLGEVSGTHTVTFALQGEQLEIIHRSESRINFAEGAIAAAKWLADKSPGLYDMQDVLGIGGTNAEIFPASARGLF